MATCRTCESNSRCMERSRGYPCRSYREKRRDGSDRDGYGLRSGTGEAADQKGDSDA